MIHMTGFISLRGNKGFAALGIVNLEVSTAENTVQKIAISM